MLAKDGRLTLALHAALVLLILPLAGCRSVEVTAVPLSRWNCNEPEGIPFYLPKPLIIVAKNVRYIESEKIGLTDSAPIPSSFDDQAKYADLNSRTELRGLPAGTTAQAAAIGSTPSTAAAAATAAVSGQHLTAPKPPYLAPDVAPTDGLMPDTFYTVQIVFVPDLSQKYGLRVKGGAGELRAALNLVNGWMFTGLGPFYFKDSSTAQNMLSAGIMSNVAAAGAADVVRSIAELPAAAEVERFPAAAQQLQQQILELKQQLARAARPQLVQRPGTMQGYAEVHIFEPQLTEEACVAWQQICSLKFDRQYLGYLQAAISGTRAAPAAAPPPVQIQPQAAQAKKGTDGFVPAERSGRQADRPAERHEQRATFRPVPGPAASKAAAAARRINPLEGAIIAQALGLPAEAIQPAVGPEAEQAGVSAQGEPSVSAAEATRAERTEGRCRSHLHQLAARLPLLRHCLPRRAAERRVLIMR